LSQDKFSLCSSSFAIISNLIQDATISFMIADAVVLLSIMYIHYGWKATKKEVLEVEGHRAETQHELDKTADMAQKAAQRAVQKKSGYNNTNNGNKHNGTIKTAHVEKHYHIQQPGKR
jgi:hypothetical protein